jgi:hypothetical protein
MDFNLIPGEKRNFPTQEPNNPAVLSELDDVSAAPSLAARLPALTHIEVLARTPPMPLDVRCSGFITCILILPHCSS